MTVRSLIACAALALAACFSSSPAFAAAQSFVSVKGTDTGTCASPNAPCRTFAYTHNQTSAGGEILALDAGDYGPVTITKSLSITGAVPGAGVRGGPAGGVSITINAGANGVVDLTGLTLDGLGSVNRAIDALSAGSITVKNCVVRNYAARGVSYNTSAKTIIEDVFVSKIVDRAISVTGPSVFNRVLVSDVSASAIYVQGARSTISQATLTLSDKGIFPFGGNVFLSQSVVTGNNIGVHDFVFSAGDNFVRGNGTNFRNGTPDVLGKQ